MNSQLSSIQRKRLAPLAWVAVALTFAGLESFLVYSQAAKHNNGAWSPWFLYKPVMLSLPLLTAISIYRNLKSELVESDERGRLGSMSYLLALLTLVAYLTLWIGMGDFL